MNLEAFLSKYLRCLFPQAINTDKQSKKLAISCKVKIRVTNITVKKKSALPKIFSANILSQLLFTQFFLVFTHIFFTCVISESLESEVPCVGRHNINSININIGQVLCKWIKVYECIHPFNRNVPSFSHMPICCILEIQGW